MVLDTHAPLPPEGDGTLMVQLMQVATQCIEDTACTICGQLQPIFYSIIVIFTLPMQCYIRRYYRCSATYVGITDAVLYM